MEEHRVTIEGKTYRLPDPFMVIATQNPVEQVGTYPLPESQLDRFLITTGIGYPPEAMEKKIIQTGSIREGIREIKPLLTIDELLRAREAIRTTVQLSEKITEYIYLLVSATREHPMLLAGVSTRGGINLAETARSHAFLAGRDHVIPEDVKSLFVPVCAHRLIMYPENETLDRKELLQSLLDEVPVARFCRSQHRQQPDLPDGLRPAWLYGYFRNSRQVEPVEDQDQLHPARRSLRWPAYPVQHQPEEQPALVAGFPDGGRSRGTGRSFPAGRSGAVEKQKPRSRSERSRSAVAGNGNSQVTIPDQFFYPQPGCSD
jgi:hypothetical protein